jgi:23S rRNA G2069 N7-methylase RlmK/C1962 C5-methylase RlmI
MLFNRLAKRRRHLAKWARRTGVEAYRLYDRDIPEVPLVLDWYGVGEEAAIAGALYTRPYEKDAHEERLWLERMRNAVSRSLGIGGERIFIKMRERQRPGGAGGAGPPQYHKLAAARFDMVVRENGYSLRVNLSDYIDTGLFLDLRKLRAAVLRESSGKRVLNLFCYTGAFSVAAACGGAARVDSVDLSNAYLARARDNCALNGVAARCAFIREDVVRFLRQAERAGARYDMVILDPPVFSRSKKMEGVLDLRRDCAGLLDGCLAVLGKGGVLYFSAKARGFALDDAAFGAAHPGVSLADITEAIRDEDFAGRRMPATYLIRV